MWETIGAEKLSVFSAYYGQAVLAERLGITQQAVSSWVCGLRRPPPHIRVVLWRIACIPEHDWLTDDERAEIVRLSAA